MAWNFSEFEKKHQIIHLFFYDKDYYFTFLDNLTKNDLPNYCSSDIFSLYSSVMCDNISKMCYPLISNNAFIIKEIRKADKIKNLQQDTKNNISLEGFIISGKGKPVNIDGAFFIYEITHEFYCNNLNNLNNSIFENIKAKFIKDAENSNFYRIILKHNSFYGCSPYFHSQISQTKNTSHQKSFYSNETHYIYEQGDYKIDIDISNYNYNASISNKNITHNPKFTQNAFAWSTNVTAYGKIHNYQLFYQPTQSIPCPPNYHCNDIEDNRTTVYLCFNQSCESYGHLDNGFNISLSEIAGMNGGGVTVKYKSNTNRSTVVTFECDRSLLTKSEYTQFPLRLPTGVTLQPNEVIFSVGVSDSCPKSVVQDPSPLPSVHIPMPKNKSSTLPTPWPTPSDSSFFVRNMTHYTTFNADSLKHDIVFKGNLPILVDGDVGVMYTEFSTWNLLDCPSGWNCIKNTSANMWGCWEASESDFINNNISLKRSPSEKVVPYCHPIGDRRICARFTALSPNNLDRGVMLKYCGEFAISCELKIECNRLNSPSFFSLHQTSAIFHRSLTGPDVTYNLSSSLVCPKAFATIPFPSFSPSPTPQFDPDEAVNYHFTSETVNKSQIVIDASVFSQSEQWTVLRENETYELCFIVFNPSKQVKCPNGYNCSNFEKANAWKCNKEQKCYPVGDSRYNLSFFLNDQNDLKKGISLVYKGGFADFNFIVNMNCDESKKNKLLEFSDVNLQKSESRTILVSVLTSFVCPIIVDDDENVNSRISIGSMFILSILILLIFYISIGCLLVFLKKGVIEMPNYDFWSELAINLKTALLFLFRCGNTESYKERREYSGI